MISYRDAKPSHAAVFRPVLWAVLTFAAVALVVDGATFAIQSGADLVGPASASLAGFEPSRIGLGGTESTAADADIRPIDYLPARMTVRAPAEEGPQPDTF